MAFVKVEDLTLDRAAGFHGRSCRPNLLPQFLLLIGGTWPRALISSMATLVVHALLLLYFLFRLSQPIEKPGPTGPTGPSIFSLNLLSAAPSPEPKSEQMSKTDAPAASSTAASAPPPSEWAVSTIRVERRLDIGEMREGQEKGVASRSEHSLTTANSRSPNSGGGGSGYDPYAGAAPQRLASFGASATQPAAADLATVTIRPEFIEALRRKLHMSGTGMTVRLSLDQDGTVTALTALTPSPPTNLLASLRKMIIGRKVPLATPVSNTDGRGIEARIAI